MLTYDRHKFDTFFLGADDFWRQVDQMNEHVGKTIPTYPPYNIKKLAENKYVVEMAVAGFGKTDIEINLADNQLVVSGKISGDVPFDILHKGISDRPFTREFTLADSVVVKDAAMMNGMLRIFLEHIIPDSKKPTRVDIRDEADEVKSEREFLQE